jgi:hypothetical protein
MAVDTNYALSIAQGIASVAPSNSADPGAPSTTPTAPGAPYVDLGAISTDGLTENPSQSRQEFKRWGSISPFAAILTDVKHEFQVKFLENNPNVLGLAYRTGAALTPTGSERTRCRRSRSRARRPVARSCWTSTGSRPRTWPSTPPPPRCRRRCRRCPRSARATRRSPARPRLVLRGHLRRHAGGGERAADRRGRQLHRRHLADDLGRHHHRRRGRVAADDHRRHDGRARRPAFCFDLIQGTNHLRFYVPQGEVTAQGNITYKFDNLIEYDVTITAYPNTSGVAVKRYFLTDAIRLGL